MGAARVLGFAFFMLLAIGGIIEANGITGNVAAGCDCIGDACIKTCGPNGTLQCCMTNQGTQLVVEQKPSWPGYAASVVGMAGFFTLLAMGRKEEDMY